MSITIRPARPEETGELARVFVAAWRGGYRGVVDDDLIDALDVEQVSGWLAERIADVTLATVVAVDGGKVIGFARFGPDRDRPDPNAGYLASLYVEPVSGGRGTGRTLLAHALDALAREGLSDITLWVFADNERARDLYSRAGFVPDGTCEMDDQWRAVKVRYRLFRGHDGAGMCSPAGSTARSWPTPRSPIG